MVVDMVFACRDWGKLRKAVCGNFYAEVAAVKTHHLAENRDESHKLSFCVQYYFILQYQNSWQL
jgi:hypothetical protein